VDEQQLILVKANVKGFTGRVEMAKKVGGKHCERRQVGQMFIFNEM
jgi:hypothetical protein